MHLIWIPKYRKPVLTGALAVRVRDILRRVAFEHELTIFSGKVARDHVHVLVSHRPTQRVSEIAQWFKGISSRILLQENPRLRKLFWGRHFWAGGYLAVSSGTVTEDVIRAYIEAPEGEPIDDSRFQIDPPLNPSAYSRGSIQSFEVPAGVWRRGLFPSAGPLCRHGQSKSPLRRAASPFAERPAGTLSRGMANGSAGIRCHPPDIANPAS